MPENTSATSNSAITCDVLVIGSGAAGIATALRARQDGLDVLVVDKDRYLGGTTAISGGWLWVPGNKQGVREGDTRQEAQQYIKALAGASYNEPMVDTFLDTVPEALDFFEGKAGIEFHYPEKAPDYQMDVPGAKASGRALTVSSTDARILGEDRLRIQPYLQSYTVFGYMPEIGPDIARIMKANRELGAFVYTGKKLAKTWTQQLLHKRSFDRTNGNALMTRLLASARRKGIPMWTSTAAVELLRDEVTGRVSGAVLDGAHQGRVEARYGVVVAAGGFSGNAELRARYFAHDPKGDDHFTPTIGHHGDSLRLAAPLGGHIDDSPHQPASWGPITMFKGLRGQDRWFPHLRAFGLPGLIAVDRHGDRFANESLSYHDFGVELIERNKHEDKTFAWIIADQKAMHTYGIGFAKPWPIPQTYWKRSGYLVKAATVAALAAKIGVPADALQATLDEFNAGAAVGADPEFGRGTNWFHHFKGDLDHQPNPNLETIDKGPYYAVKVQMGDLGTYAGLAVNTDSEVLDERGQGIPGLYAVGTAAVSVFGGGYPGYGANIGPAMVFGYHVGKQLAEQAAAHPASRHDAAAAAGSTPYRPAVPAGVA